MSCCALSSCSAWQREWCEPQCGDISGWHTCQNYISSESLCSSPYAWLNMWNCTGYWQCSMSSFVAVHMHVAASMSKDSSDENVWATNQSCLFGMKLFSLLLSMYIEVNCCFCCDGHYLQYWNPPCRLLMHVLDIQWSIITWALPEEVMWTSQFWCWDLIRQMVPQELR